MKPKIRKWKLQARNKKTKKGNNNGLISSKRPSSELLWPGSESKNKRLISPLKSSNNSNQLISSQVKLQLRLTYIEQDEWVEAQVMVEDTSTGVECQPHRQHENINLERSRFGETSNALSSKENFQLH